MSTLHCHDLDMGTGWARLGGDWTGWRTASDLDWTHHQQPEGAPPDQGWKIHLSARLQDAERVRSLAAVFCRTAEWSFKYLTTRTVLERANAKDAPRTSSGKFVTIYPPASAVDEALLDRLAAIFGDCRGPRILGDLQWRKSVVHVRYGAFRSLSDWDGKPAIRDPSGALVPDRRGVVFDPPDWVELPNWAAAERHRSAGANEALSRMRVSGAYSFSNAGGVYRATDDEHGEVVVKEGREYVGEQAGRDAAGRVEDEYETLRHLERSGVAPRVHGTFRAGGSAFMMSEPVPGTPFNRAVMSQNPLTAAEADRTALDEHATSVRQAVRAIERQVERLHALGAVHGDISPRNVLVESPTAARLIDFESCTVGELSGTVGPTTPGFSAPNAVRGPDRDLFAIACLHLAALVPLTTLFPLDPGKIDEVLAAARVWFPTAPVDALRSVIGRCVALPDGNTARLTPPSVAELRDAIRSRRAATGSERRPGLERGADGLALALQRSEPDTRTPPGPLSSEAPSGAGLFSGRASEVLLGRTTPTSFARLRDEVLDTLRVDLEDGLAGIGLALLSAPPRSVHRDTVDVIAERLTEFSHDGNRAQRLPAGLRNGPSGIALFLALHGRLHDDDAAVEASRRMLEIDVQRLEHRQGWGGQLRHSGRLVPFLGSGSAGVGVALVQVFRATTDQDLLPVLHGVAEAASPEFTAHSGLLDGRAGLVHFLVDVGELGIAPFDADSVGERLDEHRRRFALHRLQTPDGVAYPDQHLRAVDDGWGHGGAGVLTALAAIEHFEGGRDVQHDVPSFLRGGHR
ncbi:protein kinase/lanthionine synthetase C family protein [Curtobacterium flaccumfaciens pv. oortii]|uniref:class III lanthionine synthetase LanKC N-terminal domain-containing protein n=1 Tax=Curtobacterium flaccumfaciens TaxID=2035 RepID=UPI001BDE7CAF|nr:phosphotransferase [Curtobacterium flaccumfaciens]MBT1623496.1 protein kinase/lanthionine synthetase C family protein [Curtobacterium flaccumfaciens pv. oortii]